MADPVALPEGFVLDATPAVPEGFQIDQPVPNPDTSAPPPVESGLSEAEIEANEILGIDPTITDRAMLIPFGRNAEGETVLALPQMAVDFARSVLVPGQVLKGTPVTVEDVSRMALNAGGLATKGLRTGKAVTKAGRMTARQIAKAPDSLDLAKGSGLKYTAARQAGAKLKADDYVGFLAGAERDMIEEGVDAALHPKLTAVFKSLSKKVGDDLDVKDLHNVRRTIGIATESLERDEARIARVLRNNFDDFVEKLPGTDQWKSARRLYIQSRKAETVERAINRASRVASGVENGLRIEFRKILNNERAIRNFNKSEKEALQAVVDGDFRTNTLKKIGRISFGTGQQSGFIGGTVGVGAGAATLGPVGAVAAPAIGYAAQKGAQRGTERAVKTLQALIGGARTAPVTSVSDTLLPARSAAGLLAGSNTEEAE